MFTLPSGTIAGSGRVRILKNTWNNAMNAIQAQFRTPTEKAYGGFEEDVSGKTGSPVLYAGTFSYPVVFVTPQMFGGGPDKTAAENTVAFNAAIATKYPVYVPPGEYELNALAKIADGVHLFGAGYASILKFNTTGIGLPLSYTGGDDQTQIDEYTQQHQWYIHDLWITNTGNVPASFIQIKTINTRIERVLFTGTVTYAIDNWWGYGAAIEKCVFLYLTGNGILWRGYWTGSAYEKWSFVNAIRSCDFTYVSGRCIEAESLDTLGIYETVFQLSGTGFYGPTRTDHAVWNLKFDTCWFEQNTGKDVDLLTPGTTEYGEALFQSTSFHPTSEGIVDLNKGGFATFIGCRTTAGAIVIYGTGSSSPDASRVVMMSTHGITRDASYIGQWVNLDGYKSGQDVALWTGTGSNPAFGNAAGGTTWRQAMGEATLEIEIGIGTTTTLGTGDWIFSSEFLAAHPRQAMGGVTPIGMAQMFDQNANICYYGAVQFLDETTLCIWPHGVAGKAGPTSPFAWASGDTLRLTITFPVDE